MNEARTNSTGYTINRNQFAQLQGLFAHCWSVIHKKTESDYSFYAQVLDKAGIPWHIQNMVADIAEDRQSVASNLKTLLKSKINNISFE